MFGRSRRIEAKLDKLLEEMKKMTQDFESFRVAVDAETNRIATAFATLLAKANTPAGLTAQEQAEADATIATLKAIGADPANPVPTPVPPVTPAP